MRAKREGTGLDGRRQDNDDAAYRLSIRSISTGSSLLSDNSRSEPLSSSSQSEAIRHSPLPGFGRKRNISGCVGTDSHHSTCFQADSFCEYNIGGQFTQNDVSQPETVDELRSRRPWQQDPVTDSKEAVDTTELDAIFHGAPGQKNVSKDDEKNDHVSPQESPRWSERSCGSDKKKNTTALNAVSVSNYLSFCKKTQFICRHIGVVVCLS